MEQILETLEGAVENVVFFNEENGYIILDMDVGGELITAVGVMGDVREGEKLTLYGKFTVNPRFGEQFQVEIFERKMPEDLPGLKKYLASGIISGIGASLAGKITDAFGDKTLEILENDPLQLTSLKGITASRALSIGEQFRAITGLRKAVTYFTRFKIDYSYVSAAWRRYGVNLIKAVESNPYCLCAGGVELPFTDAERLADELGFPKNCEERACAAVLQELREAANDGNTCLELENLSYRVGARYIIDRTAFESAVEFLRSDGEAVVYPARGASLVCLSEYYEAEQYIAQKITEMVKLSSEKTVDYSEEIAGIEWALGIEYDEIQRLAVTKSMNSRVFILTGGPGTGKTTALNAIIELCRQRKLKLKLAAPTGRAAKRISDLTEAPAQTIHRLLEADFSTGENIFRRNEENPLSCDVLIVDELSMVDVMLFAALLRAVKSSTRLILVGDSSQLPSVNAGNVLRDLLESGRIPSVELTKIFRQAAESLIITNAHAIMHGEMPEINDKTRDFFFMNSDTDEHTGRLAVSLCSERLPKSYGYDPVRDIQILCLSRVGVCGTVCLNSVLQEALNPPSRSKRELVFQGKTVFREGDKVMQIKNDYEMEWRRGAEKSRGIFNGDIGIILEADGVNNRLTIDFDGRRAVYRGEDLIRIEHAYALTVHKSQGSEYDAVIVALPQGMERLSYKNLLYTAVTRARSTLIVIGTERKIGAMISNDRREERVSCLKYMLEENFADFEEKNNEENDEQSDKT